MTESILEKLKKVNIPRRQKWGFVLVATLAVILLVLSQHPKFGYGVRFECTHHELHFRTYEEQFHFNHTSQGYTVNGDFQNATVSWSGDENINDFVFIIAAPNGTLWEGTHYLITNETSGEVFLSRAYFLSWPYDPYKMGSDQRGVYTYFRGDGTFDMNITISGWCNIPVFEIIDTRGTYCFAGIVLIALTAITCMLGREKKND
jgi:hypothetical protein